MASISGQLFFYYIKFTTYYDLYIIFRVKFLIIKYRNESSIKYGTLLYHREKKISNKTFYSCLNNHTRPVLICFFEIKYHTAVMDTILIEDIFQIPLLEKVFENVKHVRFLLLFLDL